MRHFFDNQKPFIRTPRPLITPELKRPIITTDTIDGTGTTSAKFDFTVLKDVFLEKGLDALINELTTLKNAGVVDKIVVKTDAEGKTTVLVEVDGIEYEFTGVKGETPTTDTTNTAGATDTTDTAGTTGATGTTQEQTVVDPKNGDFDLSVVPNLDAKAAELTDEEFYKSICALKEQLHTYIKAQLEASGKKYDKEIVEKELNVRLSQLREGKFSYFTVQDDTTTKIFHNIISRTINDNKTIKDFIDILKSQIQQCLNDGDFTQAKLSSKSDERLLRTSNFFLTGEEKALKKVLLRPFTEIDTFAQHTRRYLKAQYNLSDGVINNIIEEAKKTSDNISEFIDKCEMLVVKYNIQNDKNITETAAGAASKSASHDIKNIVGNTTSMHTEFGVDQSGNIVFQESSTKDVYNRLKDSLCTRLEEANVFDKLGGEGMVSKLLQTAWISTYNKYSSSTSNRTVDFVKTVLQNFEKMMEKLKTNPDYLEVFAGRMSYADANLTNDLIHYGTKTTSGNDETIIYRGKVTTDSNGVVHISNKTDDRDYQDTMTQLLEFVKEKYSNLPKDVVTNVFRNAQKQALNALIDNKNDCPYGTGNNSGRVENGTKNWGGKDNRKGDSSRIHMDQLVQMTLYYFDKLLIAELIK